MIHLGFITEGRLLLVDFFIGIFSKVFLRLTVLVVVCAKEKCKPGPEAADLKNSSRSRVSEGLENCHRKRLVSEPCSFSNCMIEDKFNVLAIKRHLGALGISYPVNRLPLPRNAPWGDKVTCTMNRDALHY